MILSLLSVTLAAFVGLVLASPYPETNAQRLARGLNPNPPQFLRAAWTPDDPTPVFAKRSQPSSTPSVTYSGRLELRDPTDSHVFGHIRNWATPGTISGLTSVGSDLLVSITLPSSGFGPCDIVATNAAFPAPFFVGGGGNSLHNVPSLNKGDRNTIDFTNVEQTPPSSVPLPSQNQADQGLYQESAIWSINPSTKELIPQWINPDGSKAPTFIAYDSRENNVFFVGDINAYNTDNDIPAVLATLFLVPSI